MQHLELETMIRDTERALLIRQLERGRLIHEADLPTENPIRTFGRRIRSIGDGIIASMTGTRAPRQPRRQLAVTSAHCHGEWQGSLS
jgi:hypothetical protein